MNRIQALILAAAATVASGAFSQSPTAGPGKTPEQAQTAGKGSKAEQRADAKTDQRKDMAASSAAMPTSSPKGSATISEQDKASGLNNKADKDTTKAGASK